VNWDNAILQYTRTWFQQNKNPGIKKLLSPYNLYPNY